MVDGIEYDCADCGCRVVAFGFHGSEETDKRCASCHWIRENVAPEHHTLMRDRLDVPLHSAPNRPESG
jgi:hypothetical protein